MLDFVGMFSVRNIVMSSIAAVMIIRPLKDTHYRVNEYIEACLILECDLAGKPLFYSKNSLTL